MCEELNELFSLEGKRKSGSYPSSALAGYRDLGLSISSVRWECLCHLPPVAFDRHYMFDYFIRCKTSVMSMLNQMQNQDKIHSPITMVHRLIGSRNFVLSDFSTHFSLLKICCPGYSGPRTNHLSNVTHGPIFVMLGQQEVLKFQEKAKPMSLQFQGAAPVSSELSTVSMENQNITGLKPKITTWATLASPSPSLPLLPSLPPSFFFLFNRQSITLFCV